jgi:hypothetical protein
MSVHRQTKLKKVNKRITLTIIALALYVGLFNLYLYRLLTNELSHRRISLMYDYITLGMIIFSFLDLKLGVYKGLHEQFNLLCFLSVIFNFVIIILTQHTILTNPLPTFVSFNGGIFIATIMIGISYIRHGFKD